MTKSRSKTRLFAAIFTLAAVALVVAAGLFIALGSGNLAPRSQEQISAEAEAHNNLGITAQDAGDLDLALTEFSEAIRLKPDYLAPYLRRADVYRTKDMPDPAIADFSRALELDPSDGQIYLERGTTYMYKGNYESALPDFDRAIELLPTLADPYFQRAIIYMERNQYDNAIDDFNKVVDLQPSWRDAYQERGKAYAGKTDYATAIDNYTQAIEIAPDDADYLYFDRAEFYRLLGDNEKAIADYEAVIEQTDNDSLRTEATQRLEKLKP